MKQFLSLTTVIFCVLLSLIFPSLATAGTKVHVESNTGNNTVCINGECTNTENNGSQQNTVCINGECTTSSGNIHKESADGSSVVDITDDDSVNPTNIIQKEAQKKLAENLKQDIQKEKEAITVKKEEVVKKVEEKKNMINEILDQIKALMEEFRLFSQ